MLYRSKALLFFLFLGISSQSEASAQVAEAQTVASQSCTTIKAQTNRRNSLSITLGSVLRPAGVEGFDIYRTIRKILQTSTAPVTAPTRAQIEAFINSLSATLPISTNASSTVGGSISWPVPITRDGRPEARLTAANLLPATASPTSVSNTTNKLTGLQPIALFNRFDLAPADYSNCGEYRIVYALYPNDAGRVLVIFEGRVRNPNGNLDLAGRKATCGLLAKFWEDLSIAGTNSKAFQKDLENFYYNGIKLRAVAPNVSASLPAGTFVTFPSVVRFANYGNPLGQVRLNLFRGGDWMLTETAIHVVGGVNKFVGQQVGSTPLVELYRDNGSAALAELQAQFRGEFRTSYMNSLTVPEQVGPDTLASTPACPPLNFTVPSLREFNDFESHSEDDDVNLQAPNRTGTVGVGKIRELAVRYIQPRQNRTAIATAAQKRFNNLTDSIVLNRANAATCAGCHQTAVGSTIFKKADGTELVWPDSGGFVHVDDIGLSGRPPAMTSLSPALNSCFLPQRDAISVKGACQ